MSPPVSPPGRVPSIPATGPGFHGPMVVLIVRQDPDGSMHLDHPPRRLGIERREGRGSIRWKSPRCRQVTSRQASIGPNRWLGASRENWAWSRKARSASPLSRGIPDRDGQLGERRWPGWSRSRPAPARSRGQQVGPVQVAEPELPALGDGPVERPAQAGATSLQPTIRGCSASCRRCFEVDWLQTQGAL